MTEDEDWMGHLINSRDSTPPAEDFKIETFDGIRYKILFTSVNNNEALDDGGVRRVHVERIPNSDVFEKMTVEEIAQYVKSVIKHMYANSPLTQTIVDAIAKTNVCSRCGGFGVEDYLIYGTSKVCDICNGSGLRPIK